MWSLQVHNLIRSDIIFVSTYDATNSAVFYAIKNVSDSFHLLKSSFRSNCKPIGLPSTESWPPLPPSHWIKVSVCSIAQIERGWVTSSQPMGSYLMDSAASIFLWPLFFAQLYSHTTATLSEWVLFAVFCRVCLRWRMPADSSVNVVVVVVSQTWWGSLWKKAHMRAREVCNGGK